MNRKALNISNLNQLWTVAGKVVDGYRETEQFFIFKADNLEWPNRIWTKQRLNEQLIQKIKTELLVGFPLVFSHFKETNEDYSPLLEKAFKLKFRQTGMSLRPESTYRVEKKINLRKVSTKSDAKIWSTSFKEAFRYKISEGIIEGSWDEISYYLAYYEGEVVGTIVLFVTDNVLGIHSLGIVPAHRKKGLAQSIMGQVLNNALEQNYDLISLQASDMARDMYLQMGFSIDFIMENYISNENCEL
jgi:GNAT superfamily N-acetyltransferase